MPSDLIAKTAVSAAENWLRQPTTISGIGIVAGAAVGGLIQAAFGETTLSAVGGAFVTGLVHLVINDNTAAPPAGGAS